MYIYACYSKIIFLEVTSFDPSCNRSIDSSLTVKLYRNSFTVFLIFCSYKSIRIYNFMNVLNNTIVYDDLKKINNYRW